MSDSVITVENLGKRYRIKHQAERQRYVALRDVLADKTMGVARRLWSGVRGPGSSGPAATSSRGTSTEDFWALKDVSFEVKQGEVVGIIGRNGAGKSTLLKILSRITEPTTGRVHLKGRVASLLEVGTGFHPELTGRENIFLNGAILGMKKAEIKKKFDEIVAFSEVEKFIDTPVKRYSSGMYVRLAFAVAAHLEPEILIVDEVLAVGDSEFQKKCLGKMGEVANAGRTVILVSHNLGTVQALAKKGVLLANGLRVTSGSIEQVIQAYLGCIGDHLSTKNASNIARRSPDLGTTIRICSVRPRSEHSLGFVLGEDLVFEVSLQSKISKNGLRFGLSVNDALGTPILSAFTQEVVEVSPVLAGNKYLVGLQDTRLAPGTYTLHLSIGAGRQQVGRREYDIVNTVLVFGISSVAVSGAGTVKWNKAYGPIIHNSSFVRADS